MKIRAAVLICGLVLVTGCDSDVDQRVRVIVPADVPGIASGVIRLSLWVYDPLLADAPATLADLDSVRFSHVQGRAQTFHLFVEATSQAARSTTSPRKDSRSRRNASYGFSGTVRVKQRHQA